MGSRVGSVAPVGRPLQFSKEQQAQPLTQRAGGWAHWAETTRTPCQNCQYLRNASFSSALNFLFQSEKTCIHWFTSQMLQQPRFGQAKPWTGTAPRSAHERQGPKYARQSMLRTCTSRKQFGNQSGTWTRNCDTGCGCPDQAATTCASAPPISSLLRETQTVLSYSIPL